MTDPTTEAQATQPAATTDAQPQSVPQPEPTTAVDAPTPPAESTATEAPQAPAPPPAAPAVGPKPLPPEVPRPAMDENSPAPDARSGDDELLREVSSRIANSQRIQRSAAVTIARRLDKTAVEQLMKLPPYPGRESVAGIINSCDARRKRRLEEERQPAE